MNATSLYVTTSRLVFQNEYNIHSSGSEQNWSDLYRLVPYLRQSLSCTVCGRILIEPYRPIDGKCQHHVCRLCVRHRKNLKPHCPWCRDNFSIEKYEENLQMRILLQCYKSLCQHIMTTPFFGLISNKSRTGNLNNGVIPNASLSDFIEEGANFQDDFKPHYDSTKNSYNILPCVFNPPPGPQPQIVLQKSNASHIVQISPHHQHQSQLTPYHQHNKSRNRIINSPTPPPPPPPPLIVNSNNFSLPTTTTTTTSTTTTTTPIIQPPKTLTTAAATTTTTTTTTKQQQTHQIVTSGTNNLVLFPNQKLILNKQQIHSNNVMKKIHQTHRKLLPAPISTTNSKLNFVAATSGSTQNSQQSKSNVSNILNHQQPNKNVQINNPPPIKTVSNGSAMYSVLYTGIGNKITIKRKTDGDDDSSQKKFTPVTTINNSNSNNNSSNNNNNNKLSKRRGCRCGNATATPGKLTCCGQRCPCYVDSRSCIDCKCRGCRNPHRPDGGKVRPLIPELACYEIQMDDSSCGSPASAGISLGTNNSNLTSSLNSLTSLQNLQTSSTNDFGSTRLTNLIGNLTAVNTKVNSNAPASAGTIYSPSTTKIVKKHSTVTFTTGQLKQPISLESSHLQHQHQQQQQSQQPQRESLLIKSADGKYQVVNLYTPSTSLQCYQGNQLQQNTTTTTTQHNLNTLLGATSNNNCNNNIQVNATNFINQTSANSGINNSFHYQAQQTPTITLSPIIVTSSPSGLETEILTGQSTNSYSLVQTSPSQQTNQISFHSNLQQSTCLDSGD